MSAVYTAKFRFAHASIAMEVIPVLDLKGGVVVHARMGMRSEYRPIVTPLSPSSRPTDVARGLLAIHPFTSFYIADLDAIERRGDNNATLLELKKAFPNLVFWLDNGVADLGSARRWLDAGIGCLVIGSETQSNGALIRHFQQDERIVLSLDFRGSMFMGPAALFAEADAWPLRVIVMTLARVGSAAGPEIAQLAAVKAKARGKRVYAAGGVRGADDLAVLAEAGISGALVATCLHNGTLTGAQIARL
jgi:phosphoribosylformimino-5-aminoimidazole carboxamide ribotide isomerase